MNKFMSYLAVLGLLVAGFTSAVTPAEATTESSTAFGFQITRYAANINQPCPAGTASIFKLTVRVKKGYDGQFVIADKGYGKGFIVRKSGVQRYSEDAPVAPAYFKNEFFWFAGPNAKLDIGTTADYIQFMATGPNMDFKLGKLKRDCVEAGQ